MSPAARRTETAEVNGFPKLVAPGFLSCALLTTLHMKRILALLLLPLIVVACDAKPRDIEVTFSHDSISLGGTLSLPDGSGPFPAIVLVTGSGPQDRNEEILGFRPFALIADSLRRAGVAVLRYDDRGVGKSTGTYAAAITDDFAADADAALRFLRGRKEIDPARVGLLGHSEGGMVAAMLGSRESAPAFIVLMAGPALPGGEVIIDQLRTLGRAGGQDSATIEAGVAVQRLVYRAIAQDNEAMWDSVKAAMRPVVRAQLAQLPPDQRFPIADTAQTVEFVVSRQLTAARSGGKWFARFISYDPAPDLARIKVPVLALFGSKDMQVSPVINRAPMERALAGNPRATVRMIDGANHLFQPAQTGLVNEYEKLPKQFAPSFLPTLVPWVRGAAGVK